MQKPLEYYEKQCGRHRHPLSGDGGVRLQADGVPVSSATVYGMNNPSPLKEDMPTGAVTNPYGRTKYIIEELRDVCVSDKDWSVVPSVTSTPSARTKRPDR